MATRRGPDNTMRTAISGTFFNAAWTNVLWTRHTVSGVPVQADVDAVVAALAAAFNNRFKSHQSVDCHYVLARSTYFLPGGGAIESIVPLVTAGTSTSGNNLPANAALGISWLASVYWRGGKPRTYMAGLRSADVSGTTDWTSAAVAAFDGAAGLFLTDANLLSSGAITDSELGFVSFRSGNVDRVPPIFFPYVGHRVHTRIDSQRRRLGRETV